jgi:alkylation response protein AidB-like acyl-CoA dehydrogenase
MLATPTESGFRIDGVIPWATGADQCDFIVSGAVIEGTTPRQILFILPTDLPGVTVEPPMPLVALGASRTSGIRCDGVPLASRWILSGPGERALAGRKKGLPIGQCFLAMGLCQSALDLIADHASEHARETHRRLADQLSLVRGRVLKYCDAAGTPDAKDAPRLRGACNDLAVRITHAAVALYKGTALIAGHPAQRLAREAMFLLVWSCPDPVIACTVELLSES